MNILKLTDKDVNITVTAEIEDISPSKHFADIDNDLSIAKGIEQQFEAGNTFAWCCMKVQCDYLGLYATDYLGCCSYKSLQDFIDNSGYYNDMVNNCLEQLNNQIAEIVTKLVTNTPT